MLASSSAMGASRLSSGRCCAIQSNAIALVLLVLSVLASHQVLGQVLGECLESCFFFFIIIFIIINSHLGSQEDKHNNTNITIQTHTHINSRWRRTIPGLSSGHWPHQRRQRSPGGAPDNHRRAASGAGGRAAGTTSAVGAHLALASNSGQRPFW